MKGINEQTKRLIQDAEQLGFRLVGRTSKGHLKFNHPGAGTAFFSGTPSDRRAAQNCLSQMKKQIREKEFECVW